jgi:hypothetical protein
MSNIVLQPNASGTGSITITTPNTNTDRTLNIPDVTGNVVTTGDTGSVSPSMLAGGHGGLKSIQVFDTAGTGQTYTKPAGINTIKVFVTGAGGGGGGYGGPNDYGAGGGAGGTAIKIIDATSITTVNVNVGTGGAGGSGAGAGTGGNGSSFGAYATGNGGAGGQHGNVGPVTGGVGGSATGGDINITGGEGTNGVDNDYAPSGTNYRPSYGTGGASFWGGGGRGSVFTTDPQGGSAYGSGGGGDGSPNANGAGAGKQGVVIVEEYA